MKDYTITIDGKVYNVGLIIAALVNFVNAILEKFAPQVNDAFEDVAAEIK